MAISLKNIRDRVANVEGFITTASANDYIANRGTVSGTQNLAGLPLEHYNCGGSCSWTCSGSCTYGVGGGTFVPVNNQLILTIDASVDDGQGLYIDFNTGILTLWVENDDRAHYYTVTAGRTGEVWKDILNGSGSNPGNGFNWGNEANRKKHQIFDSAAFGINGIDRAHNIKLAIDGKSGRPNVWVEQQPNDSNGWVGKVKVTDPSGGSAGYSYRLLLTTD